MQDTVCGIQSTSYFFVLTFLRERFRIWCNATSCVTVLNPHLSRCAQFHVSKYTRRFRNASVSLRAAGPGAG
jgi:hypothetical protein